MSAALSEKLGLPLFREPVETNPYLPLFYENMAAYAFPMQIFLLNERFRQQQQIIWQNKGAVQDRSIYEDGVFATMLHDAGLMSDLDYTTYKALFANISNFMKRPTLLVYLNVSPAEAWRRIRVRGRTCELGITLEYLEQLHAAYTRFIDEISLTVPVLRVDYETYRSWEEMAEGIAHHCNTMNTIRDF